MNKNFKHNNKSTSDQKRIGKVEIVNPIAQLIFDDNTYLEIVAEDLLYADSPVWIEAENLLLFTDFPNKKIHYWKEHYKAPKTYLESIDFIGPNTKNGELNSSVLLLNHTAELTLFLYGEQKIAKMNAMIRDPKFNFTAWIDNPKQHILTNPSTFTQDNTGNIYFTDIIPNQELFNEQQLYGLFKISNKNKLELLLKSSLHIEGITFSPNNKLMYVTYFLDKQAYLYSYELNKSKHITSTLKTFDYTPFISTPEDKPRGLTTDKFGNIFTTGPGGLWVFSKELDLIARVYFKGIVTNCVFNEDYKTLYITTSNKLLKLKLRN